MGSTRSRLNWQQSRPSSRCTMASHCSGSGQRFTAKHVLIPRCRRGILPVPSNQIRLPSGFSTADHLVAFELAFIERYEHAVKDTFAIVAARVNANGASNLARGMGFMDVAMQAQ